MKYNLVPYKYTMIYIMNYPPGNILICFLWTKYEKICVVVSFCKMKFYEQKCSFILHKMLELQIVSLLILEAGYIIDFGI